MDALSSTASGGVATAYVVAGAAAGVAEGLVGAAKELSLGAASTAGEHASRLGSSLVSATYTLVGVGTGMLHGAAIVARSLVREGPNKGKLSMEDAVNFVDEARSREVMEKEELVSSCDDISASGYSSPDRDSQLLTNGGHAALLANGSSDESSAAAVEAADDGHAPEMQNGGMAHTRRGSKSAGKKKGRRTP